MTLRPLMLAAIAAFGVAAVETAPAFAANSSSIIQDGRVNTANVNQRGRSNDAQTIQNGRENLANHTQRGRNNTSGIGQTGGGFNEANVSQRSRR